MEYKKRYAGTANDIANIAAFVSRRAQAVYAQICRHVDRKTGISFATVPTLAAAMRCSESTFQRGKRELVEKGFLHFEERIVGGRQTSNVWIVAKVIDHVKAGSLAMISKLKIQLARRIWRQREHQGKAKIWKAGFGAGFDHAVSLYSRGVRIDTPESESRLLSEEKAGNETDGPSADRSYLFENRLSGQKPTTVRLCRFRI